MKNEKTTKVNKSEIMRKMWKEGISISDISKQTNSHYSFVYETIKKFARKSNTKFSTNRADVVREADMFRSDYDAGLLIGEIAKKYNKNYSYVWTVIDKHRSAEKS